MRIPCTCGCGQEVTYATKINHLNGRGKTSLRARVLEENESLKPSTSQQPVLRQKKKRSHPSSNQTGSRKRLKGDQLDVDLPAQAYTDPMESLPTPALNQGPESPISKYPRSPLLKHLKYLQTLQNPPLHQYQTKHLMVHLFSKRTQAQKNCFLHRNQMVESRMVLLHPKHLQT